MAAVPPSGCVEWLLNFLGVAVLPGQVHFQVHYHIRILPEISYDCHTCLLLRAAGLAGDVAGRDGEHTTLQSIEPGTTPRLVDVVAEATSESQEKSEEGVAAVAGEWREKPVPGQSRLGWTMAAEELSSWESEATLRFGRCLRWAVRHPH